MDPESDDYDDDLDRLRNELDEALAHEEALRNLEIEVTEARDRLDAANAEERGALLVLTGGEDLSESALAELRSMLGFYAVNRAYGARR